MRHTDTLVIGAGLAGLATGWFARQAGLDLQVLEAASIPGGVAITHRDKGYQFDVTGHWLHMRDPGIKEAFGSLTPMTSVVRKSMIFTHDRFVAYPFQSNLRDLPDPVKVRCLMDAIEAHCRRKQGLPQPERFGDFVLHHFGQGIADEFMFPYNQKLWGVEPNEISHAWTQRFVPVPDLKGIVEGCFTDKNLAAGYNASFSYPPTGGIDHFSNALAAQVPTVEYGKRVVRIHAAERWLETSDGVRRPYRNLVTSMPLKALISCLVDAPEEIRNAGAALSCTSLSYFDLGLNRPALQGLHWVYLPQPGLPLYRLGCYSNAIPAMAPPGCSSIYVELASGVPLDPEAALDATLGVISAMGDPVTRQNVEVCTLRTEAFSYVIYDHKYEKARSVCLSYLEDNAIHSIGRYGKWVYASMEDALIDGREIVERLAGRKING